MEVPVFLIDSSEEEEVAVAANVNKRKYEEYRQISDLSGFDNLRAMMEAEAFMRRNRRERRERKKMKKKQAEKKTEKIIMVNIEKPVILITDSESEDANKLKKKKYEDEYRVIADLTGFDNLKGMMEAEAFRRRKTRKKKKKKKKKNGNALCYAQEEVSEKNMAERVEEIISGNMKQEIENPMILTASSKDEDANNMKKKFEDEYRVISDLTGFDNLRAMYEAETLMRRKKRKRLRKGKAKIVYHSQEDVSVDATKGVGQSARVQAAETTELLEAASVEVDMARGEKQAVTNKVLESALLLENETVGRNYKMVSRRLLRSRYFDPSDGSWDIGGNCGEECHSIVNYKVQKRKRPCFVCASFDHSWKSCKQDSVVWKGRGHSAKDCLDNQNSNICLRCGTKVELDGVLKNAAMEDRTVILTTLNEAWAEPQSMFDVFLSSFRIGNGTQRLLNHLVVICLDPKAYARCLALHPHCYNFDSKGTNFSREAFFMTPAYLEMMWDRIDLLSSILKLGYNFVFTDTDIMWLQDPFQRFYSDADFQIACDQFYGDSYDVNNRPNGGFNYVKSNNRTVTFYKYWYESRKKYPGKHDQNVLNMIKADPFVTENIGIKMRFLDTVYFGGFCEPSKDFNLVCTMHANCCVGLENKVYDLKILLEDWSKFKSLPQSMKASQPSSWTVPQKCRGSLERSREKGKMH